MSACFEKSIGRNGRMDDGFNYSALYKYKRSF